MDTSTADRRPSPTPAHSVADLVLRSWWNVDHEAAVGGEHYFTPAGICRMPAITMSGRAEIGAGYAKRQTAGARLSRHMVTNLLVEPLSDSEARARYLVTLYAGSGKAPLVLTEPQAVVDVVDHCALAEGRWLVQDRQLTSVFISASNDSVMLEPAHDV